MASLYTKAAQDGADIGCNFAVVNQYSAVQSGGDRRGIAIPRPTGDLIYLGVSRATYPREYMNFDGFPTAFNRVVNVNTFNALNSAVANAQLGDAIVVDNTVPYVGNITNFPKLNGDVRPGTNNVVTVISKAIYNTLVNGVSTVLPNQKRILNTTNLVRFINASTAGVAHIEMDGATSGWRFVGFWFDLDASVTDLQRYVRLGNNTGAKQPNASFCPTNVGIDRCYFGGHALSQVRHALEAHAKAWYVIDSYFSDYIVYTGADSQSLFTNNGPGPGAVINNRLAEATEAIIAGGSNSVCGTPSDVEVKFNQGQRPLTYIEGHPSWDGKERQIKNGMEVKNAAYWDIAYNYWENIPQDEQEGFAFLCKTEPYGDTARGYTHDVIYRHNRIKNSACGVNIATISDNNGGQQAPPLYRICIFGNLGTEMAAPYFYDTSGRYFGLGMCKDVTLAHNTWWPLGTMNSIVSFPNPLTNPYGDGLADNLTFTDNLIGPSTYGAKAAGHGTGTASFDYGSTNYIVKGNVFTGADSTLYPTGNFFPANQAAVLFNDPTNGDWSLIGTTQGTGGGSGGGGTQPGPNIGTVGITAKSIGIDATASATNVGTVTIAGGRASLALNFDYSPNIGAVTLAVGQSNITAIGVGSQNIGTIDLSAGGGGLVLTGTAFLPPPPVVVDPTSTVVVDDDTPVAVVEIPESIATTT